MMTYSFNLAFSQSCREEGRGRHASSITFQELQPKCTAHQFISKFRRYIERNEGTSVNVSIAKLHFGDLYVFHQSLWLL